MMGNTSITHESNLSMAPLYLDTTTILYSMNKINKKAGANMHAMNHHQTGEEEDNEDEYDPEDDKQRSKTGMLGQFKRSRATHQHTRNAEEETIHENSSMLMGMGILQTGVVENQHIREEYGENDDSQDEEESGEHPEMNLVGETPPI